MPKGGPRPGSGRPRGSTGPNGPTKRTNEIRAKAFEEGITPLEVMLLAMRAHVKAQDLDKAAAVAKDAAPYMHPRLAAVEHTGKDGGAIQHENVTNEDRARALLSLLASVRQQEATLQ